jgi:hypothetical protein
MAKIRKYFPNNWDEYKEADDDMFIEHTFEELMDWKVANWQLPSSVFCIIRETCIKTGQVKEHVYQKRGAARNKLNELMERDDTEICLVDHEAIHNFTPVTNDE